MAALGKTDQAGNNLACRIISCRTPHEPFLMMSWKNGLAVHYGLDSAEPMPAPGIAVVWGCDRLSGLRIFRRSRAAGSAGEREGKDSRFPSHGFISGSGNQRIVRANFPRPQRRGLSRIWSCLIFYLSIIIGQLKYETSLSYQRQVRASPPASFLRVGFPRSLNER